MAYAQDICYKPSLKEAYSFLNAFLSIIIRLTCLGLPANCSAPAKYGHVNKKSVQYIYCSEHVKHWLSLIFSRYIIVMLNNENV